MADPVQLRPLGLGEIFDRAVTLYVRHFAALTIIALFIVLPLAVAQYFATAHDTSYQQLLSQIEHPGRTQATPASPFSGVLFIYFALAIVLAPYATVAIAAAAGAIYRGEPIDWRRAYGIALRHWSAVLMTVVCEVALLAIALIGIGIVLGVLFSSAFVLFRIAAPFAFLLTIIAAALSIAFFLFIVMFYLSFAFAFNAIGIEELPFGRAISRGFARIFNRTEIGRAAVISLALVAVYIGLTIVSMVVAGLFMGITHLAAINSAMQACVTLVSTAFLGVLIAVYYFDVRVRREGLDMQAEIAQLEAPAST